MVYELQGYCILMPYEIGKNQHSALTSNCFCVVVRYMNINQFLILHRWDLEGEAMSIPEGF